METNTVVEASPLMEQTSSGVHRPFEDVIIYTLVPLGTMFILCVIKTAIYTILKHKNRGHTASCVKVLQEKQVDGSEKCLCLKYDRLPWYYSDLCCDVLSCFGLLVMGIYSLHYTDVQMTPFKAHNSFMHMSSKISLSVAVGNQLYRFMRLSIGPEAKCRVKMSHLSVTIAMVMFVSVIVTREDIVLGLVGTLTSTPTLAYTIRQIVVHRDNGTGIETPCSVYAASVLRIVSILVFSILLPVLYLSFAVITESPLIMSYYSLALFTFCVAFFGVDFLTECISAICTACRDIGLARNTERVRLIHRRAPPENRKCIFGTLEQGLTPSGENLYLYDNYKSCDEYPLITSVSKNYSPLKKAKN